LMGPRGPVIGIVQLQKVRLGLVVRRRHFAKADAQFAILISLEPEPVGN
jgi:hypothetical protein